MASVSIQRRAERLVRGNRFTIAVVVPVVGAVLLVAGAERLLPAWLAFNPLLVLAGTLVMRLPLLVGLLPLVDRRLGTFLVAATAYTYGIELVGVATGWPYGEFRYVVELGPMVGGVPLGLPLFFLPLVVNAYVLATLLVDAVGRGRLARLGTALALVIGIDLVLDPAAVALGFWTYLGGGAYYGVPASNFLGWLLSGAVVLAALEAGVPRERLRARLRDCEFVLDDLVSFVLLWGGVNALYGNWIPVGIAVLFVFGLRRVGRFDVGLVDGRFDPGTWRTP